MTIQQGPAAGWEPGKAVSLVFQLLQISAANLWGEIVKVKPCQSLLVGSLLFQALEQL